MGAVRPIGIGWGHCRGLTPEELEMIDWSQINLNEVLPDIEAQMSAPDQALLKLNLQQKVEQFHDDYRAQKANSADDPDDFNR